VGELLLRVRGGLLLQRSTVLTGTQGCTPSELRADTFPLWCALLNAVHRGVKVRLLTNDYTVPNVPPPGKIDPLTFLYLNGVQIRFFATVTFLHEKYIGALPFFRSLLSHP
jgi:hypothetical protein